MRARQAQHFHLFLKLKLLSLQFMDAERIVTRASGFFLYDLFQRLMTGSKFAESGFNRHRSILHLVNIWSRAKPYRLVR